MATTARAGRRGIAAEGSKPRAAGGSALQGSWCYRGETPRVRPVARRGPPPYHFRAMTRTLTPLHLAGRMSRLGTESAFEVLARAKALEAQGRSIIHLEIGEPDFDTPANVVAAAVQALQEGWTHYNPSAGLMETREAVAEYIGSTRGVEVAPEEVCIVPGAKPVIFYTLTMCVEQGDEVIYPNPGFPIYESMIHFTGGTAVSLPIREENGFAFSAEDILSRVSERTRLIILNNPANPTGGVTSREEMEKLAAGLQDRPDIWILSDEIYSRLLYDGAEHVSPFSDPSIRERVILLDGWSKTYAMTGWRIGYAVARRDFIAKMAQLAINGNSCTCTFTQKAAIEALRGDQGSVEAMRQEFDRRRRRIVELLNEVPGFSCHLPKGAFYVFPNVKPLGWKSNELQRRLLDEAGVACLAGTAFGAEGEGHLRFSYAASIADIEEAIARVRRVVESL